MPAGQAFISFSCHLTPLPAAGLELLVWTVNDTAHGQRLREAGVNGITTDVPDRL